MNRGLGLTWRNLGGLFGDYFVEEGSGRTPRTGLLVGVRHELLADTRIFVTFVMGIAERVEFATFIDDSYGKRDSVCIV